MANDEHVRRLLNEGVEAWNAWREAEPDVQPDLRNANLRSAKLRSADLRSADLRESSLSDAKLSDAKLSDANLSDANLWETKFIEVDLLTSKGLETCNHSGPSTIDHRTLSRSSKLPLAFLRGCGLSDWEIESAKLHQKGLSQQEVIDITYEIANLNLQSPLGFHSCFISYTKVDEAFATKLHGKLQSAGVRCWYAPEDIKAGQKIRDQLDRAIRDHDKLLLALSPQSITSAWVQYELRRARQREREDKRRMLFPLGLLDYDELQKWEYFDTDGITDLAAEVREYFIPGFSNWQNDKAFDAAFERLLHDLRAEAEAAQQ